MFLKVFLLALVTAIDPERIAAVAYMLSRKRPLRLLIAYLIGGFGVGLIGGIIILFLLKEISAGRSVPPGIEIAVGVFAIVVAVLVGSGLSGKIAATWSGTRAPAPDGDAQPDPRQRMLDKLPGFAQRALTQDSPWVAWIAGIYMGTPSALYLAAIAVVLQAAPGARDQILALLLFNAVAFVLVEIPILGYLIAPEATSARVQALYAWMRTHRRWVIFTLTGGIGVFLLVVGIGKL